MLFVSFAVSAWAQSADEFVLPEFEADAGVPSPPPAPPLETPTPVARTKATPKPAEPPTWHRFTGTAAGLISGLNDWYAGISLFGGAVLGTPTVLPGPGTFRELQGWVWMPGFDFTWARIGGPVCGGGRDLCGTRVAGGAAFRGGYAFGVADVDGEVFHRYLFFAQLTAQLANVNVPSAPLVPGSRWLEAVFRLQFGTNVNLSNQLRGWLVIHFSAFVEALAFGARGTSAQFGAMAGVSI